jgi:hypothetical protein
MNGRSNTSKARTPSGPNLASEGASICTEPELQGLHLLAVLEQRAVGVELDLDPALGALLGELLEELGALALGRLDRYDVTELDDDRLLRVRQTDGQRDRGDSTQQHMAFHGPP